MKKTLLFASLLAAGMSLQAQTAFELNYFKQALADAEGGNVVVSPLSAGILAGMIASGAEGSTLQEMLDVMGYNSLQELNFDMYKSIDYLQYCTGEDCTVELHNALWGETSQLLKPEYLQTMEDTYYAESHSIRLDSEACSEINQWVSDKTHGLIPDLLSSIDPSIQLIMVNTLYAQAKWADAFEPRNAIAFNNYDGTSSNINMMRQESGRLYYEDSDYRLVRVACKDKLEMILIIPNNNKDIKGFVSQLNPKALANSISKMQSKTVRLTMPYLCHSTKVDLAKELYAMGIKEVFSDGANFSAMTDIENFQPKAATQQAYISIDENGIVGAAASEAEWWVSDSGEDQQHIDVLVNHPYCYMLRDKVTHSMLFMGAVASFNETSFTSIDALPAVAPATRTYNLQGMPTHERHGLVIEEGRMKLFQ